MTIEQRSLRVVTAVGGLTAVLFIFWTGRQACATTSREQYRSQVLMVCTACFSSFLWIFLLSLLIRREWLLKTPLATVGLAWPILVSVFDMANMDRRIYDVSQTTPRQAQQMDSNAVTGIAFAISGLISSTMGKSESLSCVFSVVIILCLCFILQPPSFHPASSQGVVFGALQKSALSYAVGLLIYGVSMHIGHVMSLSRSDALGAGPGVARPAKKSRG